MIPCSSAKTLTIFFPGIMPKYKSYFLDLLANQKVSTGLQEMLVLLNGHTEVAALEKKGKACLNRQDLLRKDQHLNIISETQVAFESGKVGAQFKEFLDELVWLGIIGNEPPPIPKPEPNHNNSSAQQPITSIENIKDKIADDDLEGALSDIEIILAPTQKEKLKKEVISYRNRLSRNDQNFRKNHISINKHGRERSILSFIILDLLDIINLNVVGSQKRKASSIPVSEASVPELIKPEFLKILFFESNPKGTAVLNISSELKKIKKVLKIAISSKLLSLTDFGSTSFEDFRENIDEQNPNVIHFSGHGSAKKKALLMLDAFEEADYISATKLERFFASLSKEVTCVILNACSTASVGLKIAKHVKYVIAMRDEVENMTAKSFSKGFYSALAKGKTIDTAFKKGRDEIFYNDHPDENIPVLFIDGRKIT